MLIVPISHENQEARRWPVVTIAIVAINVLVFVATLFVGADAEHEAARIAKEVSSYQADHPYLEVKCRGIQSVGKRTSPPAELALDILDEEQATLDASCARYDAAAAQVPNVAYGDVPARGGFLTLVTYQFLHAGFLHLGFNLWFLWLCGTNLEDRWGRAVFLPFYLTAGIVAGLAHRTMSPGSWTPLVGASGAIAGAMGGFLVTYAATRIVFFYVYFLTIKPRWGTFGAPAYVMLPLWLLSELFDGFVGTSDGTSHWAHIGGFAFGAVIALGLKLSGIDAKLDAMNELTVSSQQDPRLVSAMEMTDVGRPAEALSALAALARESPGNIDVQLEILRAATAARDTPRRVDAYLRLMNLYVSSGAIDTAADLWAELRLHGLEASIPRAERLHMGEVLSRKGRDDVAILCFASAYADGLVDPVAVRGAVLRAMLLVRMGRLHDARELLEEAKASPFSTHELDQKIDAQLAAIEARSSVEMGSAS